MLANNDITRPTIHPLSVMLAVLKVPKRMELPSLFEKTKAYNQQDKKASKYMSSFLSWFTPSSENTFYSTCDHISVLGKPSLRLYVNSVRTNFFSCLGGSGPYLEGFLHQNFIHMLNDTFCLAPPRL